MSHDLPRSLAAAALVPLLALALTPAARAEQVLLQSSGVYTLDTPVTPFSAPGAAWSLSIVLDRRPTPIPDENFTFPGFTTAIPFVHVEVLVDGVPTELPRYLLLYSLAHAGGMDLIFGGIQVEPVYRFDSLGTFGDAYYSGSELAPTIEPGSYTPFHPEHSGQFVGYDNVRYYQAPSLITISAVPTPASAAMMLGGLVALPLFKRLRRPA